MTTEEKNKLGKNRVKVVCCSFAKGTFGVLLLAFLVLFSSTASASSCPSKSNFRNYVIIAIDDYKGSGPAGMTSDEVNDIIGFYLFKNVSTADCDEVGSRSGETINYIFDKIESANCPTFTSLRVSPNPASSQTVFEAFGQNIEQIRIMVYNILQILVYDSNWRTGTQHVWDLKDINGENLATGTYYFKMYVKGCGNQKDSDTQQMSIERPTTTTTIADGPDLTIVDLTFYTPDGDGIARLGRRIGYMVTIKNIGDKPLTGSYTEHAYYDNTYLRFEGGINKPVNPGELYTIKQYSNKNLTSTGYHTIKLVVDSQNVIAEQDESNNEKTHTFNVYAASAAVADSDDTLSCSEECISGGYSAGKCSYFSCIFGGTNIGKTNCGFLQSCCCK